ncbi:hypothetical protein CsSME_00002007 [Camellia sinensis var. sinensis]
MGSDSEPEPQPSSTPPKLPLFSLPSKPHEPPGMVTPPLQTLASVPFHWEEAPGKPRPCTSKPKAVRCLDLPPRLLNEAKITNTPSPTTVLDGPYSARSLSHTLSFSMGKASFRSPEAGVVRKQIGKERWNFSSWRWPGSFKQNAGAVDDGGSFDFSPSVGCGPCESGPCESDALEESEVKTSKVRKRSSFFGSSKSNLWTSIYESVKQAVPWRHKQQKMKT